MPGSTAPDPPETDELDPVPAGPPAMRLIAVLSVALGILASVAIVVSVIALVRVDGQVKAIQETQRNIETTQQATFEARRGSARGACELREDLKRDIVTALKFFGADTHELPRDEDGRRLFQPLAGGKRGCELYSLQLVPESNRP